MYNFTSQIITLVIGFALKTVFIQVLGKEFLGLNSLFLSILSMLSIAELGIGSAIAFSLYKPLVEEDNNRIMALMNLFRKSYILIGLFILAAGALMLPFLKHFVNLDRALPVNYSLVFLLLLVNTAIPYLFFDYRIVIIYANQKEYRVKKIQFVFAIATAFIQVFYLFAWKSFYGYLIVPIIMGVFQGIIISHKAGKMFPVINIKNKEKIDRKEKRLILRNVYALAISKISTAIYTSTDFIIISVYVGTAVVGVCSNYYLIVSLVSILADIFGSFTSSVGHMNAKESTEFKLKVFDRMQFANMWLYGFTTVCLYQLASPFIRLWIGEQYILNTVTVTCLIAGFTVQGLIKTVLLFENACGLFWKVKYRALIGGFVNIVASLILVRVMGVAGVLLGTLIGVITTTLLIDPVVLYKEVFKMKASSYYLWYLKAISLTILSVIIVKIACLPIVTNGWFSFIGQLVICLIVPNALFIIFYRKSAEYAYYKELVANQLIQYIGLHKI